MKAQSKPFFISKNEKTYVAGEGMTRQFTGYDDNIMMVKINLEKGAIGAKHQHPHSQVSYVVSGKFEMTIGDQVEIISAGDGYYVEPNVIHGCVCLEAGILIDVFTPIREDFYETIQ